MKIPARPTNRGTLSAVHGHGGLRGAQVPHDDPTWFLQVSPDDDLDDLDDLDFHYDDDDGDDDDGLRGTQVLHDHAA